MRNERVAEPLRAIVNSISRAKDRDLKTAQEANARVEELKIARDRAEHDMNHHRDGCQKCLGYTPIDMRAGYSHCADGMDVARAYLEANRRLRNGA